MNDTSPQLVADLMLCETRVWQALVTGDRQADAAALHDSFLGVYSDGFAGKDDHLAQLDGGPTIETFKLSDCRVLSLGGDHALLSYSASFHRKGHSEAEAMYVSSIWQQNDEGWINIFSQDPPAIA